MGRTTTVSRIRALAALAAGMAPVRAAVPLLEALAGTVPGALAVLTYHRVDEAGARPWLYPALLSATPGSFVEQMGMIRQHYTPVSLPEVLEAQRGGVTLPARAVLVTFDDAYRDFRENAWPVLDRMGIPATLFVPTAYPDRPDLTFWWDRIWAAVLFGPARSALEAHLAASLDTEEDRRRTAMLLVERHKTLSYEEAQEHLAALEHLSGREPDASEVLGWDELRDLARRGVFLAPHSRTHPVLTRLSDAMLHDEIKGSGDDLAAQVPGASAGAAFAYPAGRYDERVIAELGAARFELGFTTQRGTNRLGLTNSLRMRRINVGLRADPALIRLQVVLGNLRRRVGGG